MNKESMESRAGDFADNVILPGMGAALSGDFPVGIWEKMGTEGLLGAGLPKEFGGMGLDWKGVASMVRAMTLFGGVPGLVLSFIIHNLTAGLLINRFGDSRQKKKYLQDAAKGRLTVSFAVSEPRVGPHPKRLGTRAEKTGKGWLINGEKSWLTNGPIAGGVIVFAVTGEAGGMKEYTAFLVDRETKGLGFTPAVDPGFLRPVGHCGIILEDCLAGEDSVLGPPGRAYNEMALTFRKYEDVLLASLAAGVMERLAGLAAGGIPSETRDGFSENLGGLAASAAGALALANRAAEILDSLEKGDRSADHLEIELQGILVFAMKAAGDFEREYVSLLEDSPLEPAPEMDSLAGDLSGLLSLGAGGVKSKKKKLGSSPVFLTST